MRRKAPYAGDTRRAKKGMMTAPAISMEGVDLSLGRGAARVHILRNISLAIGRGVAYRLGRP